MTQAEKNKIIVDAISAEFTPGGMAIAAMGFHILLMASGKGGYEESRALVRKVQISLAKQDLQIEDYTEVKAGSNT